MAEEFIAVLCFSSVLPVPESLVAVSVTFRVFPVSVRVSCLPVSVFHHVTVTGGMVRVPLFSGMKTIFWVLVPVMPFFPSVEFISALSG